ncbi:MAG: methyltransferase [Candidatus Thermoplasmatota archaeon]|nr:methyltransferase [Candidatus Thermoplasmatota archaeon]
MERESKSINMAGIKKKNLEIQLEQIPVHPDPEANLEQYSTPSSIASDILFRAYTNGHIKGKKIADLGCGTGIFSIGSAYLGAKSVEAIDVDDKAIRVAKEEAESWSVSDVINFEVDDIREFETRVDTVIMNPPFGSQKKGADLPFLKKAFQISSVVYTIHNAETRGFLENFIKERGHILFWEKRYMFEISNMFEFHDKERKSFEVISFGIKVKRE